MLTERINGDRAFFRQETKTGTRTRTRTIPDRTADKPIKHSILGATSKCLLLL